MCGGKTTAVVKSGRRLHFRPGVTSDDAYKHLLARRRQFLGSFKTQSWQAPVAKS